MHSRAQEERVNDEVRKRVGLSLLCSDVISDPLEAVTLLVNLDRSFDDLDGR